MNIDKNTLMKLSIPAGLAVAAAVFQSMAIRHVVQTERFVVLANDLEAGDIIDSDDIHSVDISTNFAPPGAILQKDSAIAVGSSVIRSVKADHLLLRDDLLVDRHTLSITSDEVPIVYKIENDVLRSNNFHVGQSVHLLFYNEGDEISIEGRTYPSEQEVEIGPLRIASIGSAIAPYSENPDEKIRTVSIAVNKNHPDKPLLWKAQDRESTISLRGIYSRPSNHPIR